MRIDAVEGRVDVASAGQDQPVEQVEYLVGFLFEVAVWRDHHHEPTGALDRLDVAGGEKHGIALLPYAPVRAGDRRADADYGPFFDHSLLRLARLILPDAVLGSSSANSTMRGYLYGAVWDLTCSW